MVAADITARTRRESPGIPAVPALIRSEAHGEALTACRGTCLTPSCRHCPTPELPRGRQPRRGRPALTTPESVDFSGLGWVGVLPLSAYADHSDGRQGRCAAAAPRVTGSSWTLSLTIHVCKALGDLSSLRVLTLGCHCP